MMPADVDESSLANGREVQHDTRILTVTRLRYQAPGKHEHHLVRDRPASGVAFDRDLHEQLDRPGTGFADVASNVCQQ
jgi:hypothetical protein